MRSNTESEVTVISASTPTGGDTAGEPERAITSPSLSTISRGSSGLPVWLAGHTEVQRPQMVQASVSYNCFQVNSPTLEAPTVSMSVASSRLGISRMAPLGRVRADSAMLTGEVSRWRSLVTGSTMAKAAKDTAWVIQITWWATRTVLAGNR